VKKKMVNSNIKHKAVKATLDKGYASEWNDHHVIASGDSFPVTPEEGWLFYRTDIHELYCYDGTTWRALW